MTQKQQTYRAVDDLMKNNEKHLVSFVLGYLNFCKHCHKQNDLCKCEKCIDCKTKAKNHKYKTFDEPLCEVCYEMKDYKMCDTCQSLFDWELVSYCWDCDEKFCDEDCHKLHYDKFHDEKCSGCNYEGELNCQCHLCYREFCKYDCFEKHFCHT